MSSTTPKRARKVRKGLPDDNLGNGPGDHSGADALDLEAEEFSYQDPFEDLFGDGTEQVMVKIFRTEPIFFGGSPCTGYLGLLPPDGREDYIKDNYGGGKYRLLRMINSRFAGDKRIQIVGDPKVALAPPPAASPKPADRSQPSTALPSGEVVDGVPIGGTDEDFLKRLERITLLRAAIPKEVDINAVLLQHALNQNKGSSVSELLEILTKAGELKEVFGGGGSGSGGDSGDLSVTALLGKGIDAFLEFVKAQKAARPAGSAPEPAKPAVTSHVKPAELTVGPSANMAVPGAEGGEGVVKLEIFQVANVAVGHVVKSFISEPPLSVAETVDVLRLALPAFDAETKAAIQGNRETLWNMCRTSADREIELTPEDIEKFHLFYTEVFDIFLA